MDNETGEGHTLAQGQAARKRQSWDLNLGCLVLIPTAAVSTLNACVSSEPPPNLPQRILDQPGSLPQTPSTSSASALPRVPDSSCRCGYLWQDGYQRFRGPKKVPDPAPFCHSLGQACQGTEARASWHRPHNDRPSLLSSDHLQGAENFSLRETVGPHLIGRGPWSGSCVSIASSLFPHRLWVYSGAKQAREKVLALTVYMSQQGEVGGMYPHSLRMPLGGCPFCMYRPSSY